jgi:hypothetical protein
VNFWRRALAVRHFFLRRQTEIHFKTQETAQENTTKTETAEHTQKGKTHTPQRGQTQTKTHN